MFISKSWYWNSVFIIAATLKVDVTLSCQMSDCVPSTEVYKCSGTFKTELFKEPCDLNSKSYMTMCCEANSSQVLLHSTFGAEPNEFPFMAKLIIPQNCGGSIYNKRFIITAAHCVSVVDIDDDKIPLENMQIILGSNSAKNKYSENNYKVKRVIIHENFTLKTKKAMEQANNKVANDIALIELTRDIEFGPFVKALKLAPKDFRPTDFAESISLVSWGTTTALWTDINYLEHPSHLQKLNFLIRENDDCFGTEKNVTTTTRIPFPSYRQYQDQLLCLGGILKGKWSAFGANGDSGSPAVCRGPDGHALQCGHVYMAVIHETCFPDPNEVRCFPSLFEKTPYFGDWIRSIAGSQDGAIFFNEFVYGERVEPGRILHQVHVIPESGKGCGGTLIQSDVVLTTASCVDQSNGKIKVQVWNNDTFGVIKTEILDGFKLLGDPLSVKIKYRTLFVDQYYKNDLAILKLDGKIKGNLEGKLPRLPEDGEVFKNGKEYAFSRKESVGAKLDGNGPTMMLRKFEILPDEECDKRTARMKDIGSLKFFVDWDENILCGFEKSAAGSICDRELGGGLLCEGKNGELVLCGVQVFRLCEWSVPNGFLDLSKYSKWIQNTIKQLS